MYTLLHQYLITHKQLDLPGIGLLQVIDIPARYTIAEKQLYAPHPTIRCKPERMQVNPELYTWLSKQLSVSEIAAKQQFDTFMDSLLNELTEHKQIIWKGVGLFIKDDLNNIHFTRQNAIENYLPSITIEKNINYSLNQVAGKKIYKDSAWGRSNWGIWIFMIIIILSNTILVYFFIQEGISFVTSIELFKYIFYSLFI